MLGTESVRDHLIDSARSFIFDTGLAPASVGAALAALQLLAAEPWRQARCGHARNLAEVCDVPEPPESAVVSVILGDPDAAVAAASACVWMPACGWRVFRPPTVPAGTSRLRLTARAS